MAVVIPRTEVEAAYLRHAEAVKEAKAAFDAAVSEANKMLTIELLSARS